jgi:hypothetical protein
MTTILNPLTKRFVKESGSVGKIIKSLKDWELTEESTNNTIKKLIKFQNDYKAKNKKNWDKDAIKIINFHNPTKTRDDISELMKKTRKEIREISKRDDEIIAILLQHLRNVETRKEEEKDKRKKEVKKIMEKYNTKHTQCECPICLNFEETTEEIVELKCKHSYHKGCISQWLQESKSCPMCKRVVK